MAGQVRTPAEMAEHKAAADTLVRLLTEAVAVGQRLEDFDLLGLPGHEAESITTTLMTTLGRAIGLRVML